VVEVVIQCGFRLILSISDEGGTKISQLHEKVHRYTGANLIHGEAYLFVASVGTKFIKCGALRNLCSPPFTTTISIEFFT